MANATPERGVRSQAIRDYLKQNPKSSSKEVVAGLAKTGVEVSEGLVNNVKYGKRKGSAKRGARRSVKPTRLRGASSKEQVAVSKSQHIRDYLAHHMNASPKEIVAALQEKGIEVTPGLASLIKYSNRERHGTKSRAPLGRAFSHRGPATGNRLSANDLLEAKRIVDGLGGITAAREALAILERLS